MVSKKSFKLHVVSNTTPFFAVVQIIYFHDCSWNIFMKVPLCTSVASVFIELPNLFSSENDRTRLIFTRPRVVLTRNRNFKMAVDLLESKLYM